MRKIFKRKDFLFWLPVLFGFIFFVDLFFASFFADSYNNFLNKLGISGYIFQSIMTSFGLFIFALFPILLFLSPLLAVLYIIHRRHQKKRIEGGVQLKSNTQEVVQRFYRTRRIILLDFLVAFIIALLIPSQFPSYEWGGISNFIQFVAYLVIVFLILLGISFFLNKYIRKLR